MKKYKWIIILLNLIILLVYFNSSIVKKEHILADGKLILLKLAPVDPRSLMQGDYMTLSYAISEGIDNESVSKRGFCVVKLNADGVARRIRLQKNTTPINEGEYLIEYTSAKWRFNIGAESFFFEEGQAEKFEIAEYGGIKVDNKGNSILIGLYDKNLKKIE